MKSSLIQFILFNEYSKKTLIFLFVAGVFTFFMTLAIKLKGWQILEYLRNEVLFKEAAESNDQFIKTANFFNPTSLRVMIILQAHSFSYTAISLLIVLNLLLTQSQGNG